MKKPVYILHNNRCSKSRKAIASLEENNIPFQIVNYLDHEMTETDIKTLIEKLNVKPVDVIRKGEAIYKENYKGKNFTDKEWISILAKNPKLIERPILYTDTAAVIGRPDENVTNFIKNLN